MREREFASTGARTVPIPGYEGLYGVDENGNVYSEDRYVKNRHGTHTLRRGRKMLLSDCNGYLRVTLCANNKRKRFLAHRLVMSAFKGAPPEGTCVMHLDGDRKNNRLENLRYGSHSCNEAFKIDHGTLLTCEEHGTATITDNDAREVVNLRKKGTTLSDIARRFNISVATVGKICNGQLWRRATGLRAKQFRKNLNRSKASMIREYFLAGGKRESIAASFGISGSQLKNILANKSWRDRKYGNLIERRFDGSSERDHK